MRLVPLSGIILGLIEAFGSYYISAAYKDAFSFIVFLLILLLEAAKVCWAARTSPRCKGGEGVEIDQVAECHSSCHSNFCCDFSTFSVP